MSRHLQCNSYGYLKTANLRTSQVYHSERLKARSSYKNYETVVLLRHDALIYAQLKAETLQKVKEALKGWREKKKPCSPCRMSKQIVSF